MKTPSEFTIKDLSRKPDADYANFKGENRVFTMFNPISPEMAKLKENDKFSYKSKIYRIVMKILLDINPPQNIQFNCLKELET